MTGQRPVHGFTAVDRQEDLAAWVRTLDTVQREPFYAAYKARTLELLAPQPGRRYLDVGGGTGADARTLMEAAGAEAVVLDLSKTMAAEARRRGVGLAVVGDAATLPFATGTFDGCRVDRTFQHLADPEGTLHELMRVTRAGASWPSIPTTTPRWSRSPIKRWRGASCASGPTTASATGPSPTGWRACSPLSGCAMFVRRE